MLKQILIEESNYTIQCLGSSTEINERQQTANNRIINACTNFHVYLWSYGPCKESRLVHTGCMKFLVEEIIS